MVFSPEWSSTADGIHGVMSGDGTRVGLGEGSLPGDPVLTGAVGGDEGEGAGLCAAEADGVRPGVKPVGVGGTGVNSAEHANVAKAITNTTRPLRSQAGPDWLVAISFLGLLERPASAEETGAVTKLTIRPGRHADVAAKGGCRVGMAQASADVRNRRAPIDLD